MIDVVFVIRKRSEYCWRQRYIYLYDYESRSVVDGCGYDRDYLLRKIKNGSLLNSEDDYASDDCKKRRRKV